MALTAARIALGLMLAFTPRAWADDRLDSQLLVRQRAGLLATAAQLGEAVAPSGCDTQRIYRGVYAPSFAPSLVITLRLGSTPDAGTPTATLELVLQRGGPRAGVAAARFSTPVELGPRIDALTRLDAVTPRTLTDLPSAVLDGMGVLGTVCGPGEPPVDFVGWSPHAPTPHHLYFRALADLARLAFRDETPLFAAETAVTYLTEPGELVYADTGGEPRVIRLTGISSGEAEPFRALVASVGPTAGLIIDLRNFSGAGTMFRPEFEALDHRKGRTLWVISKQGMAYLANSFGISRAHVVATMDAAKQRLK